jgi:gephyrin
MILAHRLCTGEKDLLKETLLDMGGTIHFGRVHMKPGKPTTFVTVPKPSGKGVCLVFSLPGNPVSCVVTFHLFVAIALDALRGLGHSPPRTITAVLAADAHLDPRPEYHRVALVYSDKGKAVRAWVVCCVRVRVLCVVCCVCVCVCLKC